MICSILAVFETGSLIVKLKILGVYCRGVQGLEFEATLVLVVPSTNLYL